MRLNIKRYKLPLYKAAAWHFFMLLLTPFAGLLETYVIFTAPLVAHNFVRRPTPK